MAERCCLTEGRDEWELLDVRRDVDGPDGVEAVEPVLFAPAHEPGDGPVVGLPGVGVTDGDGEEVDEAPRRAVVGRRRSWAGAGLRMRREVLPECTVDELLGHGLSCFSEEFGKVTKRLS